MTKRLWPLVAIAGLLFGMLMSHMSPQNHETSPDIRDWTSFTLTNTEPMICPPDVCYWILRDDSGEKIGLCGEDVQQQEKIRDFCRDTSCQLQICNQARQ